MSESFSVGEIAIIHCVANEKNGDECEIVALVRPVDYVSEVTGNLIFAGKLLVLYRGKYFQVFSKHLRKRRPPRDPTSTWDDMIVWRPKDTSHVG
jgi:hypothetical protein